MISDKNISVKSLAIGTLSIVITGLALACISTSQLLNTADRVQAQEQERSTAAISCGWWGECYSTMDNLCLKE